MYRLFFDDPQQYQKKERKKIMSNVIIERGFYMEKVMQLLAAECGYEVVTKLAKAREHAFKNCSWRLQEINQACVKAGKRGFNWDKTPDHVILDHLYKVDMVLNIGGSLIGVQLTSWPVGSPELIRKNNQVSRAANLCKTVGFNWTTIVTWPLEPDRDISWGLFTPNEKERLKDAFYDLIDNIIDQMDPEDGSKPVIKPIVFTG